LSRLFSLHFVVPLFIVVLVVVHLLFLHFTGSSSCLGVNSNFDKVKFFPYFIIKDSFLLLLISLFLVLLISMCPDLLGDPENFNISSIVTTPTHIKPEWYFLFAYAILRCIPSKLGGVVLMVMSIFMLFVVPFLKRSSISGKFGFFSKLVFWFFVVLMLLLT